MEHRRQPTGAVTLHVESRSKGLANRPPTRAVEPIGPELFDAAIETDHVRPSRYGKGVGGHALPPYVGVQRIGPDLDPLPSRLMEVSCYGGDGGPIESRTAETANSPRAG